MKSGFPALCILFAVWSFQASATTVPADCSPQPVSEGCGAFQWPDGTRYVGNFHGGYFDGFGTITFPDGAKLEMNFTGSGSDAVFTEADGTKITGPFHDTSADINHPRTPLRFPFWRALFGDHTSIIMTMIVGEDGSVITAAPYQKIDSESFTKSAGDGVKQWHYLPATIGGHPIRMPRFAEIQFAQPS